MNLSRTFSLAAIITFFSFHIFSGALSAQTGCPGCQIDMSCYDASGPALCPSTLPDGIQGQYYDTDITFWMPQNFVYQGVNITLQQIVITGVGGLPQGLSWQPNNANMTYVITSDPATQRGCVKLCGTPAIPGNFTITVNVTATVMTPLGQQVQPQSFTLNLYIAPPSGGNPFFSFNPASGCDVATVTFQALLNVGAPQLTTYQWDFGNGQSSTLQNPPPVTYNTPGVYPVTLTTNIYDHVFNSITISASGNWYSGDVEELFGGQPDLYFVLTHGGSTFQANYISDSNPAVFNNLGIVLSSLSISLSIWEYDPVSANDDGGTFTFQVPGPGTYNFSTSAPGGGGGTTGSFTITTQLNASYPFTDTVWVYNLPPALPIQVEPSHTVCEGNEIKLSVYGGYLYQWFENDTVPIAGANDSVYIVTATSGFPVTRHISVKIMDPVSGCSTTTPPVTVTINPGIPAGFSSNGIIVSPFNPNQLTTSYVGNFTYQWLWNGIPINPGGSGKDLTIPGNGSFSLVITNNYGCSDTSNVITINNYSLESAVSHALLMWPNPASEELFVKLPEDLGAHFRGAIWDVSGREVMTLGTISFSDDGIMRVSVSSLKNGLYYLRVENGEHHYVNPFVKR
jgi:PKD repeat protein